MYVATFFSVFQDMLQSTQALTLTTEPASPGFLNRHVHPQSETNHLRKRRLVVQKIFLEIFFEK